MTDTAGITIIGLIWLAAIIYAFIIAKGEK